MQTRRLFIGAALLLLVGPLAAGEAKKFIVGIAGAKEIDFARDHFSIGIVDGWVSSKDGFFKALLSKRKKMVVGIEGEVTLFDNEVVKQAIVHNNEDIGRRLDRPWGLNLMLQSRVPADVSSRLEFRIALHRDDRIAQIFKAAEDSNAAIVADLFAKDWAGYAKFVSSIFKSVFGTDKTNYPFYARIDVPHSDSSGVHEMKEHYIVLIAPSSDKDRGLQDMDQSKLAYDASKRQLLYGSDIMKGRTYVVLKVSLARGYEILQLLYESKAAWAVLARETLDGMATGSAKNAEDLQGLSAERLKHLNAELELLIKEHRFTKYERAVALYAFCNEAIVAIEKRGKELGLPKSPVADLTNYRDRIAKRFGLSTELALEMKSEAATFKLRGFQESRGER
ncbi:MAG: hypothetical protein ACYTEG_01665 [Planctomycetota bacterium]|jgi:hypothetical protein